MTGSTTRGTPTREHVQQAAELLFSAGVMLGQAQMREAKADWFLHHHGDVDDLERVVRYATAKSDGDAGGLIFHILDDGQHTKEVVAYMRRQSGKAGRRAAPEMNLPTTPGERARAAGYEGIDDWERERTHAIMWERWAHDRRGYAYEERLAAIAAEFGYSVEDAYDILSEHARRDCKHRLESLEHALKGAEADTLATDRKRTPTCVAELRRKVDEARAAMDTTKSLEEW